MKKACMCIFSGLLISVLLIANIDLGLLNNAPNTALAATAYYDVPGGQVKFDTYNQAIYGYTGSPTALNLPSSIQGIPVVKINNLVFKNCVTLKSMSLPDSIESIGYDAFTGTPWYNTQPNGVVYAGKVAYKYKGIMPENTSITLLPGTVGVASSAFINCNTMINIVFPSSIRFLGQDSFLNCTGLTCLYIPKNVKDCSYSPFNGCYNIRSASVESGATNVASYLFAYLRNLTDVVLPDSITSIGRFAFYNCSQLSEINLPAGLKSIGNYAYYNCGQLMTVNFPTKLESLGESAFENCTGLTSIAIPKSLSDCSGMVFAGCTNIISASMEDGAVKVPNYIFSDLEGLKNVILPSTVTSIGDSAFFYCRGLTWIDLPKNLKNIGRSSFSDCTSLKEIIFPDGLESLGMMAFQDCTSLVSLTIPMSLKYIAEPDLLDRTPFSHCINVTRVEVENGATSVMPYLFGFLPNLKDVIIPESVTSIGDYAFSNCTGLTTLHLPSQLKIIGLYAFRECSSLTRITVPGSVTRIGGGAFFYCTALKSAVIPPSVVYMGKGFPSDIWNFATFAKCNLSLLTVYGSSSSYAQQYCSSMDISFKTLNIELGAGTKVSKNEFTISIRDPDKNELVSGVTVTIEGISGSAVTDAHGIARFTDITGKQTRKISVSKPGYQAFETLQIVANSNSINLFIRPDNGIPYLKSMQVIIGGKLYDILNATYNWIEDKDDDSITQIFINASFLGKTPQYYRFFQDDEIKYFTASNSSQLQVGLDVQKIFKPGYKVYVEIIATDGTSSGKIQTGINIKTKAFKASDPVSGSIRISPASPGFTLSDSIPLIGGLDVNFSLPGFPVTAEVFDDGKVKISVGMDDGTKSWEQKAADWDETYTKFQQQKLKSEFSGEKLNYKLFPKKGDFSWKVMGYGEGKLDQYGRAIVDIKFLVSAGGGVKFGRQFMVWVIPVYVEFKGGLKGTFIGGGRIILKDYVPQLVKATGDFTLEVYLNGKAAAGIRGIAGLGFKGDGHWYNKWVLDTGYFKSWLQGGISLFGECLMLGDFDLPLLRGEVLVYENGSKSSAAKQSVSEGLKALYARKSFTPLSRDYLSAKANTTAAELSSGNMLVKSAVYPDSQPKLVSTGGLQYLFWLNDDGTRSAENRTSLVYATSTDGVIWSKPIEIDKDATADFNFSVSVKGTDIFIAWQNSKTVLPSGVTTPDMAAASEICAAKIDTAASGAPITKYLITTNDIADLFPSISSDQDTVIVAWYSNSANDVYGQNGNNAVSYSLFNGTSWSAPATLTTVSGQPIISLSAGFLSGEYAVAYSLDQGTVDDLLTKSELYLSVNGELPKRLTDNDMPDTSPRFMKLSDRQVLMWYNESSLMSVSSLDGAVSKVFSAENLSLSPDFSLVSGNKQDYLVWSTLSSDSDMLRTRIYASTCSNGCWSSPYLLTELDDDVSALSGLVDNAGRIHCTYLYRDAADDGYTSDLYSTTLGLLPDITLLSADADTDSISPGQPASVSLMIANSGSKPVDNCSIRLLNGTTEIYTGTLANMGLGLGDTKTYTASIAVPANLSAATQFTIVISADTEAITCDNTVPITLGYSDLTIKVEKQLVRDKVYADILISNTTPFATDAMLKIKSGGENGAEVFAMNLEAITNAESRVALCDISQLSDAINNDQLYFCLESSNEEMLVSNNCTWLDLMGIASSKGIVYGTANLSDAIVNPDTQTITASGTIDASQPVALALGQGDSWELYLDGGLTSIVEGKKLGTLHAGENKYYAKVTSENGIQSVWILAVSRPSFTVQYNSLGGSYVDPAIVSPGATITKPADPIRLGYDFIGWYKQQECTSPWNFVTDKVTSAVTLYAKWTIKTYMVTFNSQGGTTVASQTVAVNGLVAKPANPTRTGYTFGGWYKQAACTTAWNFATDKVTAATTIWAKWMAVVSFNSQGGSAVASQSIAVNGLVAKPANPTRAGYTFGGWYKQAACTTAWNFATDKVTAATTIWAKWMLPVSFNSQGGTAVASQTVAVNGLVTKPANPTRTGYTFGGWYKQAACTTAWNFATDKVTAATTIWARWMLPVSFNSQGGSAVASQTVALNGLVAKPANPTRTGYTFGGWYKQAACTTAWNFATDKVTAATTIWAKWTINTYTVTFNSQGGTTVASKTAQFGATIPAPASPTRTGCNFVGWFTAATGGAKVTFPYQVKNSVTIYAQWSVRAPANLCAISATNNSIKLTWTAASGVTGYSVVRSLSSSFSSPVTLPVPAGASTYTDTGLKPGTTYYYKVCAYVGTTKKAYSAYTAAIGSAVSTSYTSARLTWGAVAGTAYYEVSRATTAAGAYTILGKPTACTIIDSKATTGSTYYYRVRAYNGTTKAFGPYRTIGSITIVPAIPSSVSAARVSPTSVKVAWVAVVGASGYEISRATSATGVFSVITSVTTTSYTNINLKTGTTYFYKVRAYKSVGGAKVYGLPSVVVSAKP